MTKQRLGMNWLALGLVASLLGIALGACTKVEDDDNSPSKGRGGANATGGATATLTATKGKGGATATTTTSKGGATTTTTSSTGTGSGSLGGNGSGGTTATPCPDLLNILNPGEAGVCSTANVAASFSQINMLIVVDKSGSMNTVPPGYSNSKWVGAVNSLKEALKPGETLIRYGLMLYPYSTKTATTTCELADGDAAVNISVGSAATTVPAINELMGKTTPSGGTPTAKALDSALKYYTTGPGVVLDGPKYVLLVTDGGPNCNGAITCAPETCTANMDKSPAVCGAPDGVANCCDGTATAGSISPQSLCLDDLNVLGRLQDLAAAGIKTFVVGIPGTEVYASYLDTFAKAGGVPVTDPTKTHSYYEVTGESGLLETFNAITTSLVRSCKVPLQDTPKDLSNINVAIDCSPIPKSTAGVPNWHYDATLKSIVIEGTQCTRIETTGVNRVDVVLGCVPFEIN